jgi:hypothetical protein
MTQSPLLGGVEPALQDLIKAASAFIENTRTSQIAQTEKWQDLARASDDAARVLATVRTLRRKPPHP